MTAVSVGLSIAAGALILFHFGPRYVVALVLVVVVLAAAELFAAVRHGGFRPATLLGLAACAALPLATYWRGEPAVPLVLFLLVAFGVLWFILGLGPHATANLGVTVLGAVWVGVFGSFASLILRIPAEGVSILLVTVVAAVFYDVGGFFVGRQFGRTPLTSVSPNKTVEGLAGGMAFSVLAVLIVVGIGFGPFSFSQALVFGVFCRAGRADRRPGRVGGQARPRAQGHGHPAAGPRRRARPVRRAPVRAAHRVLRGPVPAPGRLSRSAGLVRAPSRDVGAGADR